MDRIVPFISKVSKPTFGIINVANRLISQLGEMKANLENAEILQEFLKLCIKCMENVNKCPDEDQQRLQPYLGPLMKALEKAEDLLEAMQSTRCGCWLFPCIMNQWMKWVRRFVFSPAWNRQIKEIHESLNNIQTALGADGFFQYVELREKMTHVFQRMNEYLDLASKKEIKRHRKKVSKAKQSLQKKNCLIISQKEQITELERKLLKKDDQIQEVIRSKERESKEMMERLSTLQSLFHIQASLLQSKKEVILNREEEIHELKEKLLEQANVIEKLPVSNGFFVERPEIHGQSRKIKTGSTLRAAQNRQLQACIDMQNHRELIAQHSASRHRATKPRSTTSRRMLPGVPDHLVDIDPSNPPSRAEVFEAVEEDNDPYGDWFDLFFLDFEDLED